MSSIADRRHTSLAQLALLARALVLGAAAAACVPDDPDLVRSAWARLEVQYCTADGATRAWRTEDSALLEHLRGLFVSGERTGLTMILTSYTNEVRLELASGQRWRLYYTDTPGHVTFHDPDSPKRSFSLDVADQFFIALNDAITAGGGGGILLRGACRMAPASPTP